MHAIGLLDPLPIDALIAAVAVSCGLPLFTQNAADYVGITDLVVVPVP